MPALEAIDAYFKTLIAEREAATSHVLNPDALPGHRMSVIVYDMEASRQDLYAACEKKFPALAEQPVDIPPVVELEPGAPKAA